MADSQPRVRPISGIIAFLMGLGAGVLYIKGYTSSVLWLRLLHVVFVSGAFLWGLKTTIWGGKRLRSDGWMGRIVPYRIEVTREGWMYFAIMVATLIGALVGRSNMLLLVFGLLAGPFVLNGHIALTILSRNYVKRLIPERIMQGEWFGVDLTLGNRRWWISSWMMFVEDQVHHGADRLHPAILFARVPPNQARTGRYQLCLQQRGRHQFGPLRLQTRFPLGLVERSYVLPCPGELLVHPRLGRLTRQWLREVQDADELVERPRGRAGAFEDEFHRLREYRSGDNLRAIHWRTSARRNTLMVREYHQTRDQDLTIVLDLWSPPGATPAHFELLEKAIRFVATLCLEHCRNSRDAQLTVGFVGANGQLWRGPANPLLMGEILDHLALIEPGDGKTLVDIAQQATQGGSTSVRHLLVTPRTEAPLAAARLQEVQQIAHHSGFVWSILPINAATLERYFEELPSTSSATSN